MNCKLTGKLINACTLVQVSQSPSPDIPPGNYHVDSLVTSAQMAELDGLLRETNIENNRLETRLEKIELHAQYLEKYAYDLEARIGELENQNAQ